MEYKLNITNRTIYSTNNSRLIKVFLIVLFSYFSYFFLTSYPGIADVFDYWNMSISQAVINNATVDFALTNPGFYTLSAIISLICSIDLATLPFLPLQFIPTFLFFFLLIKKCDANWYVAGIMMIVGIFGVGFPGTVTWWPHGVGSILYLSSIYLSLSQFKFKDKKRIELFFLMLICIVALNFVSYKLTFLALVSLLFIHLSNYLSGTTNRFELSAVIAIGSIFVLSFNQTVYNILIPKARLLMDNSAYSGIEIILQVISSKKEDSPLSLFYAHHSTELYMINFLLLAILLLFLIIFITILIIKIIKHHELSPIERVIPSIGLASLIILAIYSEMGLADMALIPFISLLSIPLLLRGNKIIKRTMVVGLVILLALVLISSFEYWDEKTTTIRDQNEYSYLSPVVDFYNEKIIIDGHTLHTSTDIFTSGYFMLMDEKLNNNVTAPTGLSEEDAQYLLNIASNNTDFIDNAYVINYRLDRITIQGWERLDSWSDSKGLILENQRLNVIYSTAYVSIIVT